MLMSFSTTLVMSTKKKKTPPTGIRYSVAKKQEVIDFVKKYNSANGRGGQSAAARKFKITPLTIAAWLRSAGVKTPTKKASKVVKTAKARKGASKKGVRYSPEKKQQVVDFVAAYNTKNGRGGQNQAAKKFNLSVLTVSAWLKAAGAKKPAKKVAAKKVAAKKVAKKAVKKVAKKAAKKAAKGRKGSK
jgi:transposase-like protein